MKRIIFSFIIIISIISCKSNKSVNISFEMRFVSENNEGVIFKNEQNHQFFLQEQILFSEKDVTSAEVERDMITGNYNVLIKLNKDACLKI